ncbi:outer membrane protein [Yoonia sp. R2-816]|uniref:outer membrane protein n=1 Tax=Yoonia sp. R2-816 TaxID=3342638 RepID=UPI00372BBC1D
MTYHVRTALLALATALPTHALADWNGAYAGLSLGSTVTSELSSDFEGSSEADPGTAFGVFGGYSVQTGDLVFGGEVALQRAPDLEHEFDEQGFSVDYDIVELKGRAGYAVNDILLYGVAGFSHIKANISRDSGSETDSDTNGFSIGVGADYDLGNNFVIGAEYLARRATFEEDEDVDVALDTLALRAAFRF